MAKEWNELIMEDWLQKEITKETVDFTERFGVYLGIDEAKESFDKNGNKKVFVERKKMTTSQLRKFFGEVKRQQIKGYNPTEFILLKPKLAYAIGRVSDNKAKINDFQFVISNAIDKVNNADDFFRFIKIFESIVAYHKSVE